MCSKLGDGNGLRRFIDHFLIFGHFFPVFVAENIFQAPIFVQFFFIVKPRIYYLLIGESFTLSTFFNLPRFFVMGYENDVLGMKD